MVKQYTVGIDEVGRGPLAGPITVAAVIKPKRFIWKNFKDSKKLSPEKREEFFLRFKKIPHAVASVSPAIIDKIGMSASARLAVGRCLKKLKIENCKLKILLDGSLYAPKTYKNPETIIK